MIDFILTSAIADDNQSLKGEIDYVLLRKVIVKKLQANVKANRLTSFRQKNEVSRAFLKRIATELMDT